jgi:hypothetical protein
MVNVKEVIQICCSLKRPRILSLIFEVVIICVTLLVFIKQSVIFGLRTKSASCGS